MRKMKVKPRGVTAKALVKRIASVTELEADLIFNFLITVACPTSPHFFQPLVTSLRSRVYLTRNEIGCYQLVRAGAWPLQNGTIYDIWPPDRDSFFRKFVVLSEAKRNGDVTPRKKNGSQTCPRTNRRRQKVH